MGPGKICGDDDENVWRLEETDEETGKKLWTGLAAIYVDDILVAGETDSIDLALKAMQQKWTTSEVTWATTTEAVKFIGMEITKDVGGDGYHISQKAYVQELISRWEVDKEMPFPNYRVEENDDYVEEALDPKDIHEAQAMAGSLLWLSTRTKPELVHGVASVCRLVTRNPRKAIEIARTLMEYVRYNPNGLHYKAKWENDSWGRRQQLKVRRHARLLEVFSDIAYGTGPGNRSIHGLFVFLGGSPIGWQCSTQPFVCQSTAESELVGYGESLTVGRSMASMIEAMWDIHPRELEKIIYGDNVAAIGASHGSTAASWRTKHLRIRAAVIKDALNADTNMPEGPWKLIHLKGVELVADGGTKALLGQSFERFIQDLGIDVPERKAIRALRGPVRRGDDGALRMALFMMIASAALVEAEAQPQDDAPNQGDGMMLLAGAVVLMMLGVVYAVQMIYAGVRRPCASTTVKSSEESWVLVVEDDENESESSEPPQQADAQQLSMASSAAEGTMLNTVGKKTTVNQGVQCSSATRTSSDTTGPSTMQPKPRKQNPWNKFQSQNAGKGWTSDKMRAEYFRQKKDK